MSTLDISGILDAEDKTGRVLRKLQRAISSISDWNSRTLSFDKAYVCAVFAKLAYLHIPRFELADNERFKVVPCETYRQLYQLFLRSGSVRGIENVLRETEAFRRFFVIERRNTILVGINVGKVIIVAVRGTLFAYEWKFNLDARGHRIPGFTDERFHRGFFSAMVASALELYDKLIEIGASPDTPVYITGHSLGGAVAAITHAVWGMSVSGEQSNFWRLSRPEITSHSCYTFGMPRYGNFSAVATFRKPLHIYNAGDVVPNVPPSIAGYWYVNCPTEFRSNGERIEISRFRHSFGSWFRVIWALLRSEGLNPEHQMETYLQRVRAQSPSANTKSTFASRHSTDGTVPGTNMLDVPAPDSNSRAGDLPVEDDWDAVGRSDSSTLGGPAGPR